MNKEHISAFAFKTSQEIEKFIIRETNNLEEENQMLQAKILKFYTDWKQVYNNYPDWTLKIPLREFKNLFNIQEDKHGHI